MNSDVNVVPGGRTMQPMHHSLDVNALGAELAQGLLGGHGLVVPGCIKAQLLEEGHLSRSHHMTSHHMTSHHHMTT